MGKRIRIVVRSVLGFLSGLFSLPTLGFGGYLLICSWRIHFNDVYYVDYPYLPSALVLLFIGGVSLACVVYGVFRRSFYGILFLPAAVFGFATMVAIPDATPHIRSMVSDSNYLSSMRSFFRVWYEAHHRFPQTEAEFDDALKSDPAAWQYRVKSPPPLSLYSRHGVRLPYTLVITPDATGPRTEDLSDRPGVIYYCVSSDQQEFWATMTSLSEDVSARATLKHVADRPEEKPWLITATGKDYPPRRHQ